MVQLYDYLELEQVLTHPAETPRVLIETIFEPFTIEKSIEELLNSIMRDPLRKVTILIAKIVKYSAVLPCASENLTKSLCVDYLVSQMMRNEPNFNARIIAKQLFFSANHKNTELYLNCNSSNWRSLVFAFQAAITNNNLNDPPHENALQFGDNGPNDGTFRNIFSFRIAQN